MNNAIVLLAPNMGDFYFTKDPKGLAKSILSNGEYKATIVTTDFDGEECAEEMFDLTNNPSRGTERALRYGMLRAVSVGDIVVCGTDMFLCMSSGWELL